MHDDFNTRGLSTCRPNQVLRVQALIGTQNCSPGIDDTRALCLPLGPTMQPFL